MSLIPHKVRAADHLIDLLIRQGTRHVFGVPGESYLPLLDAMHDRRSDIGFITCRQEGGAAMAADAYGKLTGRPGICMVTRGPGATNASAGIHIAYQDSTPMIVFIGQVASSMMGREAFQEIDYQQMFGSVAKWVAQIDDASRIQEYVSRAFRVALSGRPGPVVLALPEDILYKEIVKPPSPRFIEKTSVLPDPTAMDLLQAAIKEACQPLIIVGGSGWTETTTDDLQKFSTVQGIPVAASFRCQSLIDNTHENYVGHFNVATPPHLKAALEKTDLIIAIGPRLGEITTAGYQLIRSPVPSCALAHIYPQAEEIGRVFEADIGIACDASSFLSEAVKWDAIKPELFTTYRNGLRAQQEAFASPKSVKGDPLAPYFAHLSDVVGESAIVCNGAGNYAAWLHRFFEYRAPYSQLAPTSGSMGYGLPSAIAAAILKPDREILAIAGDGCFLMTSQEMATAAHYQLNLTIIIINNGRYGTIRAHQEREYPGRVSGTSLTNPDFCKFGEAFGAKTWKADSFDTFKHALAAAREIKGLRLIEIPVDPNYLAPGKTLEPI